MGHLLGSDHGDHGMMQETLATGERHALDGASLAEVVWLTDTPQTHITGFANGLKRGGKGLRR